LATRGALVVTPSERPVAARSLISLGSEGIDEKFHVRSFYLFHRFSDRANPIKPPANRFNIERFVFTTIMELKDIFFQTPFSLALAGPAVNHLLGQINVIHLSPIEEEILQLLSRGIAIGKCEKKSGAYITV
jgi:hypothetical protein